MLLLKEGKTNVPYLLIVIILAMIVGGGILGYYYLWIKDLETRLVVLELKIPEKIVKDETANWKVYSNDEYAFQISYPTPWIYKENVIENSFIIYFSSQPITNISSPLAQRGVIQLSIKKTDKTIVETINTLCDTPDTCASAVSARDISVGNITAKKVVAPGPIQTDVVLFKKGEHIFIFSVDYDKSSETLFGISVEEKLKTFDQMLSTFKFLD